MALRKTLRPSGGRLKDAGGKAPQIKSPRKRRRLKHIAVLPSLITLTNGLCGFASISLASYGLGASWESEMFPVANFSFFALSGYLILLGMLADLLDGHVARISKSTSSFGAQLDSLCDVITFGVAPAFLMLKVVEAYSGQVAEMGVAPLPARIAHLIAAVYVMCAIIRLARFNVENKADDDRGGFVGLPSPPAAGIIVSLIVFHQNFLPALAGRFFSPSGTLYAAIILVLPFVALFAGILMVTRIPYPHLLKMILLGKKRFSTFLAILFVLPLMVWNIQITLLLGFFVFALCGPARWLVLAARERRRAQPEDLAEKDGEEG
ncbi:MAG: phosphatidylcholine/phosphatidylserine synthase [Treponema sp.]|nr:phosphatidylcholine/phosphatidylserine synthase [Treponema sp.]